MAKNFTIEQDSVTKSFTIETGVGRAGESAVTNATVNAAIEENPAATRDSLELGTAALQDTTDFAPALGADDNYVTDAQLAVIGNTSGTNTGDQDLSGYALTTDLADYLPLAGGTMDEDADIFFDNGSKISEGVIEAGGNGGIALTCTVGYELKWEAGRLYAMGDGGTTIRVEQYGFTSIPTATDDITKGYIVGSRRILDSGTAYTCTDNTTDAAVWRLETTGNASTAVWKYRSDTGVISGDPTSGLLIWDNADQISATSINVSHKNEDNEDIELILGFIQEGQQIFLQDRDISQNYQIWLISGTPTLTGGGTANAYFTFPITLVDSGGTGTTGFPDNHRLFFGTTQALALHAPTHSIGGSDPITPDDIGALALAGGTMDDNAAILWDNASAIREAGAQGLELECSVGYRWQWVSGRIIMRQVNSGQIARIIAIDGINPSATDDETQGFVVGTRWETVDGIVYVCTDATTDAAVWLAADILASDLTPSIDATNRQLIANDGSTVLLDWSDPLYLQSSMGARFITVDNNAMYAETTGAGAVSIEGRAAGYNPAIYGNNISNGNGVFGYSSSGVGVQGYSGTTYGVVSEAGGFNDYASAGYFSNGSAAYFPQGLQTGNGMGLPASFVTSNYVSVSDGTSSDVTINPTNVAFGGSATGLYWPSVGSGAYVDATSSGGSSSIAIGNVDTIYLQSLTQCVNGLADASSVLSISTSNRRLIASDGSTVMLDWNSNTGIDAYAINTAQGYTTQGGAAVFLSGFDAGSNSGVVGSILSGVDLSSAISVDNRQLVNEAGTSIASWSNIYGLIGLSLGDGQRYIGIDSTLRFYDGTAHVDMVDWAYGLLRKSVGGGVAATTVDWANQILYDSTGVLLAMDWSTGTPAFAQGATYNPTAVASLPATPVEGTVCYVNDADTPVIGLAVVGGAAAKCLVCYNGTDWIVTSLL